MITMSDRESDLILSEHSIQIACHIPTMEDFWKWRIKENTKEMKRWVHLKESGQNKSLKNKDIKYIKKTIELNKKILKMLKDHHCSVDLAYYSDYLRDNLEYNLLLRKEKNG